MSLFVQRREREQSIISHSRLAKRVTRHENIVRQQNISIVSTCGMERNMDHLFNGRKAFQLAAKDIGPDWRARTVPSLMKLKMLLVTVERKLFSSPCVSTWLRFLSFSNTIKNSVCPNSNIYISSLSHFRSWTAIDVEQNLRVPSDSTSQYYHFQIMDPSLFWLVACWSHFIVLANYK